MKSLIQIAFFILFSPFLFGQKSDFNFINFNTKSGLSSNVIHASLKDKYGYLWFGTDDGLTKFDGVNFTIYRHSTNDSTSIGDNIIMALYEDRDGNVWIGNNAGLSLYDRKKDAFTNYQFKNNNIKFANNVIRAICADHLGNLWIGGYTGLFSFNPRTRKVKAYTSVPGKSSQLLSNTILSIFEDSHRRLWVGTNAGLNLYQRSVDNFIEYLHSETDATSIPENTVRTIAEDFHGNLWVGTYGGLCKLESDGKRFKVYRYSNTDNSTLSSNRIYDIKPDKDGKLWIGTEDGVSIFDAQAEKVVRITNNPRNKYSLVGKSVRSICIDDKDIYWIGTFQGGVNKYDRNLALFNIIQGNPLDPSGLNSSFVTAFAEAPSGDIYVGTDGSGLNLYHRQTGLFTHPKLGNGSENLSITAMERINDELWVGTFRRGLYVLNMLSGAVRHYAKGNSPGQLSNDEIFSIKQDSRGNVWIGTNGGGVNVFDSKTGRFSRIDKTNFNADTVFSINGYIRCVEEDKKGNIWIGSYGTGIAVLDASLRECRLFNRGNSNLPSDNIQDIFMDSKNNIWVATLGEGFYLYDPGNNRFISFSERDGLASSAVYKILEDQAGKIWVSTNKGLSCLDPKTRKFKNYSHYNGLQQSAFTPRSGLKTSTGELFFGGLDGLNYFNPLSLHSNKMIPSVQFTSLRITNKTNEPGELSVTKEHISMAGEITLDYKQNFSIDFVALNYTSPEENQYAYKLEGFDKDWIYSGNNRTATYTNLDPGKYTFRVKASNNDGVWNEKGTSIKITITPPFWQTWWFKLLATSIVVGSIYAVYRIRMRAINQHREELEQQVQERTQSLAMMTLEERKARQQASEANKELEKKNKELEQFAYVASHDMQEPLRTISSFVELLNAQYKDRFDERSQKYMTYIVQASDRMKVLIKDLLEYSRIGRKKESAEVDLNKVVGEVLQDLHTAIKEAGAQVSVETLPVLQAYPTEMKQLFQNLIVNAIKFRKKDTTPKIEITAEQKNGSWQFMVKDNGIGIDPKQSDRIFVIFQRLHTRNEYEGSGIGLSHCKKIAELHKGKIWVESTPGEGSTFFFTVKELLATEKEVSELAV